MPSLSPTDLAGVFTDTGLDVLADTYKEADLWFLDLFDVGDVAAISDPQFGDKSSTLVYGTGMDEHDLGAPANYTSATRGYTPQGKLRRHKKAISIPNELIEANGGIQRAVKIVAEFTRQEQVWYNDFLNTVIADIFNYGAFTAGRPQVFQASYQDNAATFDGFCYDGEPLFDDAHPLKAPNGATTTFDNYMAGLALDPTNFDLAYIRMSVTNAITETGDRTTIKPTKLLVPSNYRQQAFGITNTQNVPGSANFNENVNKGVVEHRVIDKLTASTWFLLGDPAALRIRLANRGRLAVRSYETPGNNSMTFEVSGSHLAYPRDARHLLAANTAQS